MLSVICSNFKSEMKSSYFLYNIHFIGLAIIKNSAKKAIITNNNTDKNDA